MSSSRKHRRRLATGVSAALALLCLGLAPAAQAEFGLAEVNTTFTGSESVPPMQAGSHPFEFITRIEVNTTEASGGGEIPDGAARDLKVDLPPGLVGTPTPVPTCPSADFARIDSSHAFSYCPASSQVGLTDIEVGFGPRFPDEAPEVVPVFNLVASPGYASKIGFVVKGAPVVIETGVNPDPPYNLVTDVVSIPNFIQFYRSRLVLWGVPADSAHDSDRFNCPGGFGGCSLALPEVPFLTLPSSCDGPLTTSFLARSWEEPGIWRGPFLAHTEDGLNGCERLQFAPRIAARPTNTAAESPTGLDFDVSFEDPGLTSADGIAQSTIKKTIVTLPEGVTANPSLAAGLATCSPTELGRERADSEPGEGCPQASKIGTVEVETPLLPETLLHGQVFLATQGDNPFNSLLALYMVIKEPKLGILVKLAGKVEPHPTTGQLVTTFGEPGHEIPQFPFSEFRFHFREGGRSPLVTPPTCGVHEAKARFIPWSGGAPVDTTSSFEIGSGPNAGPCPSGPLPFGPGFEAGTLSNAASAYSPFLMRLTRRDGEQDLTRFSAVLPPGVAGRIAGVPHCPEAALARAASRDGRDELASPSCPAASQIGSVLAGAGVGPELTYVDGSLYLAGPYKGAPLSVAAIVPAVAGPFDVGTVLTRVGLRLNPISGQVEVDGAASDPIPHILAGIPLKVRDIRVFADRPQFTLNPTSCEESSTLATIWGGGSHLFSTADDLPFGAASRFQAAGCAALQFSPKLAIKLRGGVKRGAHPALRAVVTPRPGQANFDRAVVTLPRSAFLEQGHIRTICTRVQFAAGAGNGAACPPGAVYGKARAWSALLDAPAEGPVFLRSSDNNLPDLVVALKGPASAPVDVELSARIDSVRGGIRSTFTGIPDLPVSRFILDMQGGKKGLIVNSRHLCFKPKRNRAKANFRGQNGRFSRTKPIVRAVKCGKRKRAVRRSHRRAGR